MTLALSDLDRFAAIAFPSGYPENLRTFYAPVDKVHDVLMTVISSATSSLVVSMYSFTDGFLAAALKEKLLDENVFVQLTLDSSQVTGAEKALLAAQSFPTTSIATGKSERGGLMHQKLLVVDGVLTVSGSTNWSRAGEYYQDNVLTVVDDPFEAARARARVDQIHAHMLQMAARKAA